MRLFQTYRLTTSANQLEDSGNGINSFFFRSAFHIGIAFSNGRWCAEHPIKSVYEPGEIFDARHRGNQACYLTGLVSGYFLCHRLIQRVGHIRSFAVFASITTTIIILHSFYVTSLFWAILNFLVGSAILVCL